jgi:hypothetical protein
MAYPPFMNGSGYLTKILDKVKTAKTPDRFTQDYLATKLGFPGGSPKAFIPFAKRLNLLASDGTPTDLYKQFRNDTTSGIAMAKAVKTGYADLFERNEYAHELDRAGLEGLVMEITGLEKGNSTLRSIISSFENVKVYADFDAKACIPLQAAEGKDEDTPTPVSAMQLDEQISLGLSYTINLVLPKTDDVAVFNAIFKSLRENLLRK